MKIRCVTNSIRFRLRKSDVELLKKHGELFDHLRFPFNQELRYGIVLSENSEAKYEDHTMTISLKQEDVMRWIESNEVSLTFVKEYEDGTKLKVLVEKDFPCKHTGDDFDDTYHELQPPEHRMYKPK